MLLAALDARKVGGLCLGEGTSHAEHQQLHIAGDRVEGRSQLVRHGSEELGFRAVGDIRLVAATLISSD